MLKTTATLKVVVELDDVPGWGNLASDYEKYIQSLLTGAIPHYNPVVTLESCSDPARLNPAAIIKWGSEKAAREGNI